MQYLSCYTEVFLRKCYSLKQVCKHSAQLAIIMEKLHVPINVHFESWGCNVRHTEGEK